MLKLSEGDTIVLQGEVTLVHDDDRVTVRLHGYDVPVAERVEHLNIVKKRPGLDLRRPRRQMGDIPN